MQHVRFMEDAVDDHQEDDAPLDYTGQGDEWGGFDNTEIDVPQAAAGDAHGRGEHGNGDENEVRLLFKFSLRLA